MKDDMNNTGDKFKATTSLSSLAGAHPDVVEAILAHSDVDLAHHEVQIGSTRGASGPSDRNSAALASTNEVATAWLLELAQGRVQALERHLAYLQGELEQARRQEPGSLLKLLRAHEAVLLYVGTKPQALQVQLAEELGADAAQGVIHSLFVLDNAPVSTDVRDAMRTACNHGMNRW